VQTPQEVYDQLAREGYRVKYYRVPLTDGTTPKVIKVRRELMRSKRKGSCTSRSSSTPSPADGTSKERLLRGTCSTMAHQLH